MPELPEMETYRQLLNEKIKGKKIKDVTINREKSVNTSSSWFVQSVKDHVVLSVDRRAKFLIFELSNGMKLVLHLMLGGFMYLGSEEDSPERTKQIILSFDEGNLYFIGLRLGYLHLHDDQSLATVFEKIGPEPLASDFSFSDFESLLHHRRSMLKTLLVDQSFLAGIGNCYSDEICFQAQLRPDKKINELTNKQQESLFRAIQNTLNSGISQGGYMETPLFENDTRTGKYKVLVYDRKDEPCYRCNEPIILDKIASKKSFYCLTCQT